MILNLMKKGEKLGEITQKLLSKSTKNKQNEENFKEMISGVPLIKSEKLGTLFLTNNNLRIKNTKIRNRVEMIISINGLKLYYFA